MTLPKFPTDSQSLRENGSLSAANLAYEGLRDRIVTLALPPGTALNETELALALGLGLTPVRDAIKRLALEHLVLVYPRRGTFVSDINLADERWLTEVRLDMEGLAAQLAALRAGTEEREAILACAHALQQEGDAAKINALDSEFHRLIYRATHNPFLEVSLQQYLSLSLRLWYFCRSRLQASPSRDDFHRQVAEAIKAGNSQAAREFIVAHLRKSSDDLRKVM